MHMFLYMKIQALEVKVVCYVHEHVYMYIYIQIHTQIYMCIYIYSSTQKVGTSISSCL